MITIPDSDVFFVLSISLIVISILAIYAIKKLVPIEILYRDNPVIGNISALIGIIYGVLAGLTALYLINNINLTSDAVQREANALANIYRDTEWLAPPTGDEIRNDVQRYLVLVMDKEWKEMKEGHRVSNQGDLIIDHMADQIYLYKGNGHSEALVVPDILQEVKTLYNARQQRIHLSFSALSPQIWLVIIIGTILTLAINYLFGMNFYLHIVSVSAAALMAASIIYLLITLDRPFQGDFIVEPDAFKELQKYINTNPIAQRKTILNM